VVVLTDPEFKSDGPDLNQSSNTTVAEYTMGIVELWTLYALAVSFTCLRTYARITAVGLRELQVDDYLVWIAIVSSKGCFVYFVLLTNRLPAYLHRPMQPRVQPGSARTWSRK